MSLEDLKEQNLDRAAFQKVCALLGTPKAAEARASGTSAELHNSRKEVRRLVNKLMAQGDEREPTADESRALHHAGTLIARIDSILDHLDGEKSAQGSGMKAMRSQSDFDKHYASKGPSVEMSVADFFRGVANMPATDSVRNSLSEGTNTAGGYTVPSVLMPQILGALAPNSALLQAGMGVVDLETVGAKTYTTAAVDSIPTAAWRLENGNVAESDATFRAIVAAPKSLAFLVKISRELLADSPNINDALLLAIGQSFAKALDAAGLRGDGVNPMPLGLKGTAGIQAIGNGANGTALSGFASIFAATQSILQADAPMPTAAIMSPRSLVKLGGLTDSTGQPLLVPPMLKDVQQISTSQIPNNLTVGSSNDCSEIYVGNFANMVMLLRERLSIQRVDQLFAGTGQIGFVCHVRADFSVLYPSAFALVTGVRP